MEDNQEENNNNITENMYCYNGGQDSNSNSNTNNEPPQQSNAIRRSLGEGENPYKYNNHINDMNEINNIEVNGEENAIRRSLGDKNPNSDFPNYAEKSSEQRFPNVHESHSPFEVKSNRLPQLNPQIAHPPFREDKQYYLINYILVAVLQIILIVMIGTAYKIGEGHPNNADNDKIDKEFSYYYHFFKDVHLMIFIGFGLLYTALKDHQWSSIGIMLFIGILSFEISFFWNYIWWNTFIYSKQNENNGNGYRGWSRICLNFEQLIQIDYISASVLISLGALIGKVSMTQLFIIVIFEPFFSSLNYYLCYIELGAIDNGGSLYIHSFGAIFGIVASIVIYCNSKENSKISNSPHLSSDYYSSIISFIGGLFLWLYFPSFNTANIQCKKEDTSIIEIMRYRGIVNTYLSMVGSTVGAFVVSPLVSNGKIKIEHLINGSYVGGIIIGGCCTICSSAWGAILIGFIGGCISVLGLWKLKKLLKARRLEDTFGILYTFGIPGILGGILNSIFMGNFKNRSWLRREIKDFFDFNRSPSRQGGIQIAAIFITIGFAGVAGIVIGFIIKTISCDKNDIYFVDSEYFKEDELIPFPEWKYPRVNEENLSSSGNKIHVEEGEVNIK
jgi:ammonium transporter Rh